MEHIIHNLLIVQVHILYSSHLLALTHAALNLHRLALADIDHQPYSDSGATVRLDQLSCTFPPPNIRTDLLFHQSVRFLKMENNEW